MFEEDENNLIGDPDQRFVGNISIARAGQLMSQGAIVLDVRTKPEYCDGHVCGAINVEMKKPPYTRQYLSNFTRRLVTALKAYSNGRGVPYNQPIIVYCRFGERANVAVEILEILGYTEVSSLGGVAVNPLRDVIIGRNMQLPICNC